MHRWLGTSLAASLLLTACVTINVYFPAAEAKEAVTWMEAAMPRARELLRKPARAA